jgi:hypothetical protein
VEGGPRERAFALSGSRLSYEATPCRETSTLAVRELDSGTEWRTEQAAGLTIERLSAAGDYVAVALADRGGATPYTATHVVVLDAARQEVRYELDFPGRPRLDGIDVASDGSLAVLTDRTWLHCDGRVVRYAPDGSAGTHAGGACELVAALPRTTLLVKGRGRGEASSLWRSRPATCGPSSRPAAASSGAPTPTAAGWSGRSSAAPAARRFTWTRSGPPPAGRCPAGASGPL